MKSKLFIVVFILLVTGIVHAAGDAKTSRTIDDKNLLDITQENEQLVIIVLKNQPLEKTTNQVKSKYSERIKSNQNEIASLLKKEKTTAYADKQKIRELKEELDEQIDALRKEVIEEQEKATRSERENVKETLARCQVVVTG